MDGQRMAVFKIQPEIAVLFKPMIQSGLQGGQGDARPEAEAVFFQAYPRRIGKQGAYPAQHFGTGSLMLGLVERVVDDAVLMKREGGGGRVSQPIDAAADKPAGN